MKEINIMHRMSLKNKFIILFISIILSMGFASIYIIQTVQIDILNHEFQNKGIAITKNLAENSANPLLVKDLVTLQHIVDNVKKVEEDVAYVYITDSKGKVIVHTFENGFPQDLEKINIIDSNYEHGIQLLYTEDGYIRDLAVPIFNGTGIAHVGLSEKRLRDIITNTTWKLLGLHFIVIIIGYIAIYLLSDFIIRPIHKLTQGAREISHGNLDYVIQVNSKDEIGELTKSFNQMSQDLKHKIEELNSSKKELEKAYKELKELDKMKSNFIDIVAHELRTPLAVIKGFVGVLEIDKDKNLTDKQKEHLKVINKNTDLLNKLINDMLYLSRMDSGMVELTYEEIDIPHLVKSVVKDFMHDIKKNKQSITLNIPDNLKIYGDEPKISQIFSNLISNAIKYTPDNGKICLNIEERDKDIIVKIRDTGIGISEKDLSKVFERFYLVDADSLTREVDRIGLGLSIVKSNVKLHGGNIWVESKLGEGSTFGFTLPKKRGKEVNG